MTENVRPGLLSFLSQHYGDLKSRLTRALGSGDLADDALHDTWLQLRKMDDSYPEVLNPRAFLQRMAVNMAISQLRSRNRAVPPSEVEALLEIEDPTPGPAHIAESRSELDTLMAIIATMPQRRQDILLLVRMEGMAQRDVAKRLGVSLSTVEQELKKAQVYCETRMRKAAGEK
jgi:RNA polymerase sigma-70 factor (ECF subfamily)